MAMQRLPQLGRGAVSLAEKTTLSPGRLYSVKASAKSPLPTTKRRDPRCSKAGKLFDQPDSPEACVKMLFPRAMTIFRENYGNFVRVVFRVHIPSRAVDYAQRDGLQSGVSQDVLDQFTSIEGESHTSVYLHRGPFVHSRDNPFMHAVADFFEYIRQHLSTFLPLFSGNCQSRYFTLVQEEAGGQKLLRQTLQSFSPNMDARYEIRVLISHALYRARCFVCGQAYAGPWRATEQAARDAIAYNVVVRIESSPDLQRRLQPSIESYSCDMARTSASDQREKRINYGGVYSHAGLSAHVAERRALESVPAWKPADLFKSFQFNELFPRLPNEGSFFVKNAKTILEAFLLYRKVYFGEYYNLRTDTAPCFSGFGSYARVVLLSHTRQVFPFGRAHVSTREAEVSACFLALSEIQNNPTNYNFYTY
ncbi:ATP-dependent helicase [Perkinsela sp. CCAP 1560/4]|nr:ATP-dependent helicase [Perkinsela sp. CCAP 1560/4]|eukprot:KNH07295.1 ATP-dependent helicase [Perkinsela sp. CCAP 1560/4]